MAHEAILDAQVVGTTVTDGMVEMSVQLSRPFDWRDARYVSMKTFPGNGPPGLPEPPRTRHQLTWSEGGEFEWAQFDFIEVGTYEFKEDFTVEAQTFGGRVLAGVFDP